MFRSLNFLKCTHCAHLHVYVQALCIYLLNHVHGHFHTHFQCIFIYLCTCVYSCASAQVKARIAEQLAHRPLSSQVLADWLSATAAATPQTLEELKKKKLGH